MFVLKVATVFPVLSSVLWQVASSLVASPPLVPRGEGPGVLGALLRVPSWKLEPHSLHKRQSCPIGSYECAVGGCCSDSSVCVTIAGVDGCCPIGRTCGPTLAGCSVEGTVPCPGTTFCCETLQACSGDTCEGSGPPPPPPTTRTTSTSFLSTSTSFLSTSTSFLSTSTSFPSASTFESSLLSPTTTPNTGTFQLPTTSTTPVQTTVTSSSGSAINFPTGGLNPNGALSMMTNSHLFCASLVVCFLLIVL